MTLPSFGRYETLHLLASGGMASVYLGRARGPAGFERLVAVKVMHEHIAHDPAFGAMFLDEARLAARIRHPNVVPTLDVAEDGRFLVMEYVEGASLHAILGRYREEERGTLPVPAALRIFLDVLAGLHAAHELADGKGRPLNLVHRDVSPHNVLVGIDGTTRITDFGIAYAEARLSTTRGGQLKGKLPYMAPEQLEDEPVDRRTDVYAAGCVLWELLTGRRLFQGSNEAAIACAVMAGAEKTPREMGAVVPASIDAVCMRALDERDARWQSALEMSEALETAAEEAGLPIAKHREVGAIARRTSPTFPPLSAITSHPLVAAGSGDGDRDEAVAAAGTRVVTATAPAPVVADAPRAAAVGPTLRSASPLGPTLRSASPLAGPSSEDPSGTPAVGIELTEGSLVSTVPGLRKSRGGPLLLGAIAMAAVAIGAWLSLRSDEPAPGPQAAQPTSAPTVAETATAGARAPGTAIDVAASPTHAPSATPSGPKSPPAGPPKRPPDVGRPATAAPPPPPPAVPSGYHPAQP
jgi:eukaryotic-like serine/threonine-protein kinase